MGLSVLMSLYRNEKKEYLEQAIHSIMQQTLMPDEIVLIKDGSLTDALDKVVDAWQKDCPILKIHGFAENKQLGRALQKGVTLCSNDLIARMDTDDIMVATRLEHQFAYMQNHPEISAVGGYIEEFDDKMEYGKVKKMPFGYKVVGQYGKFRNPLNHMTVMFRKKAVLEAGNYKHFPYLEDYHLWIRMLAIGQKLENMSEVLVRVRTNEGVYNRRGGLRYFARYCKLRKMQYQLDLLNMCEFLQSICFTMFMTLIPSFLRKIVYRRGLRRE
ncbi:MAG: glycosyltransferase [Lachnospiraceae bacterium]|nr:glycosyltransferase [Lachnospiraceae bacterium]